MICLCDSKPLNFKIKLLTQMTPWFPIIPFELLTLAHKACVWLLFAFLAFFFHLSKSWLSTLQLHWPSIPSRHQPLFCLKGFVLPPAWNSLCSQRFPWLVRIATTSKRPSLIILSGPHLFPP